MILRSEVTTSNRLASHSVHADVALLLRYWNGEDCEQGADLQEVWLRVERADWELTRHLLPAVTINCLIDLSRKIRVSFRRKMAGVRREREWRSYPAVLASTGCAWLSLAALCFARLTYVPIRYTFHIGRIQFYAR